MAGHLRHGFKADAERLAIAVREEFGLSPHDPINCIKICGELGIPTITVPMLVNSGASPKSIECLLKAEAKFSAMTIAVGSNRLIVYNPRQPVGRRANSVAHELSHILLEHPMGSALGEGGCRHWNPEVEAEADWQAATLLVPRLGALEWIRSGGSLTDGARHFGVSAALFQWRVNQTGVIRQVRALTLSRRHRSLSHCA